MKKTGGYSVEEISLHDDGDLGILYIDLPGSLIPVRVRVFTSCHYGCLGDHEGKGANGLGAI